ncbi:unnamed protein product [Fraxinus pennsylvanica]|uniref:Ionotropic glutamate receptor C-terminal domain-containing protein n=1 Tax=Fraxinus pennsylvanica TaxID=56036 RepID=A0AAD1ZW56_9LAMI|nr:unnamed protein product [Fraxinus pennsylvanica]
MKMKIQGFILFLLFCQFRSQPYPDKLKSSKQIFDKSKDSNQETNTIKIGIILDTKSWVGKVVHSCITIAISDFYMLNEQYKTRIALETRDSRGEPSDFIASAFDLLENAEVHAIMVPEMSSEESFLATLCDKANVPLLSFSSVSSSNEHPYLLQVAQDETSQFKGVAAFLGTFKWRTVVLIYEDSADARQILSHVRDTFRDNDVDAVNDIAITLRATDEEIIKKLHNLRTTRISIIIVHTSVSLASQIFKNAKMLEMMSEDYAWIMTSKTMNLLDLQNSAVESMAGVVGFRPYIPASSKLQNFTLRWRREFQHSEIDMESRGLNVFGIWAYDAIWALAEATERAGIKFFLNRGRGLGGEFQLINAKLVHETYEIVNVIGKGGRRVGFWTPTRGFAKEIYQFTDSCSSDGLKTIIWPGFSTTAPKGWLLQMSGRRLRIGITANSRFHQLVGLSYDQQTNKTKFHGFCVDVFNAAIQRLQYKILYEFIPFYRHNGSYSDLVYHVYLQTFDAAVGDITITSNRSQYVDFTLPYTELGAGVVARLGNNDPWFFLKPLSVDLWIMSAGLFILTGFIVWLIEHPINVEFQGSPAWQIGTIFWFAASTLVHAHREKLQSNLSRFVVGIWLFVVLILTSCYTANLSSLLTVHQIRLTKNDYIGQDSFIKGLHVMNNPNVKDYRLRPHSSPEEYYEALRKGSKNGGVGAIIDEIPYIKLFLAKYPHEFAMIDSRETTNGFAFVFPKGSPLVHDMSRAIAGLREEGKILELEKKWFRSQLSPLSDTEPPRTNTLGIYSFSGLFLHQNVGGRKTDIHLLNKCHIISLHRVDVTDFISSSDQNSINNVDEIKVGVIVDKGSWVGKTIHGCISMAISDFYELNSHYRTRIVLHARDSQAKPVRALSAAVDLVENIGVQAIFGLETSLEEKFLAILLEKAKLPIFSFSPSISSSTRHPYIVKIRSDETVNLEGIASILRSFEWKDAILIYEDTNDERKATPHLGESFEGKNISIPYRSVISSFSRDDQILKELQKLMTLKTKIYIVHMSLPLASRLLMHAKRLGMMKKEYAWIVTDKTMNSVHLMDSEVVESLQGTLGFKPNIAASSKLRNITSRWMREYDATDPNVVLRELPVVGIWAYDTVQAVAEAFERLSIETSNVNDQFLGLKSVEWTNFLHSHGGALLLHELSHVRFEGLSGEFQLVDGNVYPKEYSLVNIQGSEEKMVGLWRTTDGIFEEVYSSSCWINHSTDSNTMIWPEGCKTTSRGRLLQTMSPKMLRIGVPVKISFKQLVDVRYDSQTNSTTISGYCIDVFKAAIDALNYRTPYEFVPLVNGSYNDYVHQVYLQNIDGLVGDVTITTNRSLYVDFTAPFTDLGVGTIAPLNNEDMWNFLKPLDTKLWLVSGAFFFLTGFAVWAIERSNNNEEFSEGSVVYQIGTIFWFGFSTLVFAHREKLTSNLSRGIVLVWVFAVLILTSSYTATLSSLLTVQQIQLGSAGEFLGTQGDSIVSGVIANNLNFQDERLKLYLSPETYAEALSRGRKNGGVDAIIDEIPYIKIVLSKYSKDYAMIASASTTGGFGFVFPRGSPLVPDISKAIIKLREEGKLVMMERAWFKSQSSFLPDGAVTITNILNFNQFRGLFLVSGICFAIALVIYLTQLSLERFQVKNFFIRLVNRENLAFVLRFTRYNKRITIDATKERAIATMALELAYA